MSRYAVVDIETDDPLLKKLGQSYIFGAGSIIGVGIYEPETGKIGFYRPNDPYVAGILKDPEITKIFHNGIYDLSWLNVGYGLEVNGRIEDTMTRATLLDSYVGAYSLDACCYRMGVEGKNKGETIEDWWKTWGKGKGKAVEHLLEIPREVVGAYCIGDLEATWALFNAQQQPLADQDLLRANDIECRLYPFLLAMKRNGFRINVKERAQLADRLEKEYTAGIADLRARYGLEPRLAAASYLEQIWKREHLPIEYTSTGKPSFAAAVLDDCNHPIAKQIKHLKGLQKTLSTFVDGALVDYQVNGHIYPDFFPALRDEGGTVTGRYSSRAPNCQNFSAREEKYGPEIRSLFIPEEGCILGAYDYKQIEYRVFLHFASGPGAATAKQRFVENPDTDYHQMTIDLMNWGSMGKSGRHLAKNFNFTCISPDSFIATRRGYIRARDLKETDKLVLDSGDWRAFIGRKPQYRFTLSNGQQFCVTTDHPFRLFGEEVGAQTIQEGQTWEVVPNTHWGEVQTETIELLFHKIPKKYEIVVDERFAYMLGVWLGDGSMHMQYKTGEPQALSFTTSAIQRAYICELWPDQKTTTARQGDGWEVWTYSNKSLATWIRDNCGMTVTKHVPDIIYRSPRSVMISFMKGLLDSDGTTHKNIPQIFNTNEAMMRGIARCAAMLGWPAHWVKEHYNTGGHEGDLFRLRFASIPETASEFQGLKRSWIPVRTHRLDPVTVVSKEEIGIQDTFCISLPPPHWYEAECCINHNSIYGLGPRSFAERFKQNLIASHPDADPDNLYPLAKSLMDEYYRKVPFSKATCNLIQDTAARRGYVRTLSGRRQRMPADQSKVYKLVNYLIQGSASDILKKGQVDAWEAGVFNVLKIHATVHDENVFSAPKTKEGVEACRAFAEFMANAYQLTIPIGVDTEMGPDWGHCDSDNTKEYFEAYD